MNAPNRLTPPAFSYRTVDCEECNGDGYVLETASVRGEAFDADWIEVPCEECNRGQVDACCADCSRMVPLNVDGVCRDCEFDNSFVKLDAVHVGGGKWQVSL